MANKSRKCDRCDYRTSNPGAMQRHMDNTGHNKTRKTVKYVAIGKMFKKVK